MRKGGEVAAPHLLVQLGKLAAERCFARAEAGGKFGERTSKAWPALEQDERCGNTLELGDARAPLPFPRRQESFEEKPIGRQSADAERGEIVLVIAPPDSRERMVEGEELDELLRQALGRHSVKAAVAEIAAVTGLPRRAVYQRALALSTEHGRDR